MELATIAITQPTIPVPLPTDHQALMNLFYNHWQALSAATTEHNRSIMAQARTDGVEISPSLIGVDLESYSFLRDPRQDEIAQLFPPKVNAAVILGNFNYQIGNGGFLQWDDNGYSASYGSLLQLFEGASALDLEGAAEVVELLKEFDRRKTRLESYSRDDDEDETCSGDHYGDLDDRYYALARESLCQTILDRFEEVAAASFSRPLMRAA